MTGKTIKKFVKSTVAYYHAIEGDSELYVETGKTPCANKACTTIDRKKRHVATFYQHDMIDDIAIVIMQCQTCKQNTSFTYSFTHEIEDSENGTTNAIQI